MKTFILTALTLFICHNSFAQHRGELNMGFISWLKNDPKLVFSSGKHDTVRFEVDAHQLFVANDHRLADYHKIAKDTTYYADIITVDTFPHHSPKFIILFEGCIADADSIDFNKKYKFHGKELHDVAEFEVLHHNHKYFKNQKKEVKKMWWSVTKGLIKYETRDGVIWTRKD